MLVSFSDVKDNIPKAVDITWDKAKNLFTTYTSLPEKGGPCFSPVTYKKGAPRGNKGVVRVNFAVFDLDHITREQLDALRKAIQLYRLEAVIYSTFSHNPPEDNCFRLVFPLEKPVEVDDWRKTRLELMARYSIPADPATKDPARVYYFPSHPKGIEPELYTFNGDAAQAELTKLPESIVATLPAVNLADVKLKLNRLKKTESRELIKRILDGEPLAEPGARDTTLYQAAGILVYTCPEVPDEALLQILTPSIQAMEKDGTLEEELARALEKIQRQRVSWEATQAENKSIREGFFQELRDIIESGSGVYTEAEMAPWLKEQGCSSLEDFKRRWIIMHDEVFYVFVNGQYLPPLKKDGLKYSYMRDLARAPIEWETMGPKGPRTKTLEEILADYMSVAREASASLAIQKTHYDPTTQVFHEATCPIRPFKPHFHDQVDAWLRLLGGGMSDKLLDWLASVSLLNYQCAALFLEGGRGTGKGLLSAGLAKLWGVSSPTPFKGLIGNFTESVAKCPLVLADEGFPKTRDFSLLDELRRWIGSSNQTLTRKYRTDAKLNGAIRLLLAANNDRILDGMEEMTEEDRHALGERLIHIPVSSAPRIYLEKLTKQDLDSFADHKIAEHVLWLRDNRKVIPGRRFIVEGPPVSALHERLSVSGGLAPAICEFAVNRMMEMTPAQAKAVEDEFRVGLGQVWVTPGAFQDKATWETLVPGTRFPDSNTLYRTLANMRSRQVYIRTKKGTRVKFSVIPFELLKTWNSINGSYHPDELLARVSEPNSGITVP